MANNVTLTDYNGNQIVMATSETGDVHTTKHIISDALPTGDNNIGNVDLASAIPAGTNAIGTVDLAAVQNFTRAAVSAATSGDNTLVPASAAGEATKVVGLLLVAAGAVDVRLEDGAAGTALTGVISLAANQSLLLPTVSPGYHYFETSVDTLLNLELGAAVQVSGYLIYYQE